MFNKKIYIGMTKNINIRWRNNGEEYKPPKGKENTRPFYNAIKKNGWENFQKEIIEDDLTFEEACNREIYYIAFFDSRNKEKGYNISEGGSGGRMYLEHPRGMLGKKHSEEHKEMHAERYREKELNPMTNGQVVWGVTHPHPKGMLGKTHSQEYKDKVSEMMSGGRHPRAKGVKVIHNNKETIYDTVTQCQEALGITYGLITKIIKSGVPYTPHYKKQQHLDGLTIKYI